MDFDDYEHLPTNNFSIHMIAGALAGVMEHCVMYPLDSVKTRMQSLSPQVNYRGVMEALNVMIKQEGILRPVRVAGLSGVVATFLHDAIMSPSEVVKQRLQMQASPYRSIWDCAKRTYQAEGLRAFYRSYTTQLTMNVPFQSIHFMTYELCQNITNHDRKYNPPAHMVSGAIAGAVAAAITTPLDVVKTLLNTQQTRVVGMVAAFRTVYRLGGPSGYFKGMQARILYQMPSTAICWSMYELFKYLLTKSPHELVNDRTIRPGLLLVVPQVNLEPGKTPDQEDYKEPRFAGRGERTVEKAEWNSPVVPATIGALSFNTVHRDESIYETRSEMLDVRHS